MAAANHGAGAAVAGGVFRGRRWLAACLWVLGLVSLVPAVATAFLGWLAVLVMGVPLLVSAFACLAIGWGEAIARIELRDDGFSLRLPSYRGYFPFWPARRLDGKWPEVTRLSCRRVHARIIGIRFDYIVHRFETASGSVVLFEPQSNDFFQNRRGAGLNLPAREISAEFARRTGLHGQEEGEFQGGGLWRNLLFGCPDGRRRLAKPSGARPDEIGSGR